MPPGHQSIGRTEPHKVGVELVEVHAGALSDGQDEFGEQCGAVGIEQAVQGAPEPVVTEQHELAGADVEHAVDKACQAATVRSATRAWPTPTDGAGLQGPINRIAMVEHSPANSA